MIKVIYGGHWDNPPEGWVSIDYEQQDITKQLNYNEGSVDTVFTEHIFEHLPFEGAIAFCKESLRVLKDGGIMRTVCPTIDKMIRFKNDDIGKHYSDIQTKHYYPNEDAILKELGLDGIREEPIMFMFDSLFKGHNHRMIWTSEMIKKVLLKIGFKHVDILEPGYSNFGKSNCLERTVRGIDPNSVNMNNNFTYDPESMVIEAKK